MEADSGGEDKCTGLWWSGIRIKSRSTKQISQVFATEVAAVEPVVTMSWFRQHKYLLPGTQRARSEEVCSRMATLKTGSLASQSSIIHKLSLAVAGLCDQHGVVPLHGGSLAGFHEGNVARQHAALCSGTRNVGGRGWVGRWVGGWVGVGVGDWCGCEWGDRVAFRRSNKQNLSFKIKSDVLSIKRLLNEDVRLR